MQISLAAIVLSGCDSADERLARFAADATAQQAHQNRETSQLNREVVDNHRRVLDDVAKSREDVVLLDREIQQQRERLDQERRSLIEERRRESLLVPIFSNGGLMLVISLPLVLSWYLLHGLRSPSEDVSEMLIQSLVSEQFALPRSPPARQAIEQESPPEIAEERPF